MSTRGRRAPRAVVDTNILARGLLRPAGSSAALLQAAEDASFQIVLSPSILRELRKVFFKPHVRQRYPLTMEQIAGYMASLRMIAELVPSARISTSIWQMIHPVRLRCSSVTYVKYAPSSRLAGRTPRLPTDGRSSGGRH